MLPLYVFFKSNHALLPRPSTKEASLLEKEQTSYTHEQKQKQPFRESKKEYSFFVKKLHIFKISYIGTIKIFNSSNRTDPASFEF